MSRGLYRPYAVLSSVSRHTAGGKYLNRRFYEIENQHLRPQTRPTSTILSPKRLGLCGMSTKD